MFKDQSELIEAILKKMPYTSRVSDLDISESTKHVYFNWGDARFKVNLNGGVDEKEGPFLTTSPMAILIETILRS